MKGNRNENYVRATSWLLPSVVCFVEPFQSAVEKCVDAIRSAKIVGDVDSETYSHLLYGAASLFTADDLVERRTKFGFFLQQMVSLFSFCLVSVLRDCSSVTNCCYMVSSLHAFFLQAKRKRYGILHSSM